MKTARTLWVSLFNVALILVPWIVVGGLLVYYGQPLLTLYRDYFLGSPVREIERLTVSLTERPGRDLPFERLHRQFSGLRAVQNLSDSDRRSVRASTARLHGAVVARLGAGEALASPRALGDSYAAFLQQEVLERIFIRSDLVRERLMRDFDRVEKLEDLPYHPARGLDAFLERADTAAELIATYGDLYADQVTCRRVFQMECETVYRGSVIVVGERVGQFFTGWPQFARTLPARMSVINERLPRLLDVYEDLRTRLEGYLRSPPWGRYTAFQTAWESFRRHYETNLRTWYGDALAGFEMAPRRFGQEEWEARRQQLVELKTLEQIVGSRESLRAIFGTQELATRRSRLVGALRETYRWVQVNRAFDTGFRASGEDVEALARTLESFPGGQEALREDRALLERVREAHDALRAALESVDYDTLTGRLAALKPRLSEDEPVVWKIMVEQFLLQSRRHITRPTWQPDSQAGQQAYERLVRLYGELGNRLQRDEFDPGWVDRTLVAMKSRRFNQISYELRRRLTDLRKEDVPRVRSLLEELLGLQDLSEILAARAEETLFRTVLLERIVLGTRSLHGAFRERVDADPTWQTVWEQLHGLLAEVEGRDASRLVASKDLLDYVSRYGGWLEHVEDDGPLERLTHRKATDRLEGLFLRLEDWIRSQIVRPPHHAGEVDRLLDRMPGVVEAAGRARGLPGFAAELEIQDWHHVLLLRERLDALSEPVRTMTRGSLLGGDPAYERYRSRLESFRYRPLPAAYDPAPERERMRSLHERIVARANAIQRSGRGDWLAGWGGRIRGDDILKPWEAFLRVVREGTRKPSLAEQARSLLENAREVRQNW